MTNLIGLSQRAVGMNAAVIMAGGKGTRLRPYSTDEHPKQFRPIFEEQSFVELTRRRVGGLVPDSGIYVSTNNEYIALCRRLLPSIPGENIVGEPVLKNTAPALAYTTRLIADRMGEGAIIACLPSDHYIADEAGFARILQQAAAIADAGYIVTLGMTPTWPCTGYGYIQPVSAGQISEVASFREKPSRDVAQQYIDQGYLWNGGVFVWKAQTLMQELDAHAPEIAAPLKAFEAGALYLQRFFKVAPKISIDCAVMERTEEMVVIPTDVGWSDVGTWESLQQLIDSGAPVSQDVQDFMKAGKHIQI